MKWRKIPGHPNYIMSQDGLVRNLTKDRLLKPQWRKSPHYFIFSTETTFTKQAISVTKLHNLTYGGQTPNFNHLWYQNARTFIQQQNAKKGYYRTHKDKVRKVKVAPNSLDLPPKRQCATCGKPTNNYRCDECWKLLRTDYGDPTEPYKIHWR